LNAGSSSDEVYFEVLADEGLAEDVDLPSTGIPFEAEKALSAVFIRTPYYGTRCSSLVKFDSNFTWTFEERIANVAKTPHQF
jgi:uncharacterized protein with NRDE domain